MVLILDPSEFVAGMYRDGLIKESERRVRRSTQSTTQQTPQRGDEWDTWSARRSAQGPLPLSVSLYTDERDLFADLDWGADLIILDLKTRNPADETEGITLIRELRDRIPEASHLIAICHDRSLTLEATEAGADAVLVKPVRNRQLFEAAAAYL